MISLYIFFLTLVTFASGDDCVPVSHAPYTQPYTLTAYNAFRPSGRPGSSPFSWMQITLFDANTCGSLTCRVNYTSADPSPRDGFVPCNGTEGKVQYWSAWWSEELLWNLKVKKEFDGVEEDGTTQRVFHMLGNGSIPIQQVCGASGVCSWYLRDGEVGTLGVVEE